MTDQGTEKSWQSRKEDYNYWANRGLNDIITDFVRNKVKGKSWDDRYIYIRELMELEEYCVRVERGSFGNRMHFQQLRTRYPEEYRGIMKELDPEWLKKEAELQAKKAKEDEERLEREKEEERGYEKKYTQDQRAWKELGGKP